MPLFTATGKYSCPCGSETHVIMDGYGDGPGSRSVIINCWRCGHIIGLVPATRAWAASSARGARSRRLQALHAIAVQGAQPNATHRSL